MANLIAIVSDRYDLSQTQYVVAAKSVGATVGKRHISQHKFSYFPISYISPLATSVSATSLPPPVPNADLALAALRERAPHGALQSRSMIVT
ncbi:MAG: hypothetical protein V2I43_27095, partial [Parvularcula sp.]|nr:hypothetical protein [Parvularcula sp.]